MNLMILYIYIRNIQYFEKNVYHFFFPNAIILDQALTNTADSC